jgi:exonuclease III
MIRKEKKGEFVESGTFSTKYQFSVNKKISKTKLSKAKYNSLLQMQSFDPVKIMTDQEKRRTWWMYQDGFYLENEGMSGDDVKAFALVKPGKKSK